MHANRDAHAAATRVERAHRRVRDARRCPNGAQTYEAFDRDRCSCSTTRPARSTSRAREYREALAVVDERRAEWAAARQRVAALERLEERRRDEHAIEVRRAEDRLVDDLVVARHARGAHA